MTHAHAGSADKEYLKILQMAAKEGETKVELILGDLVNGEHPFTAREVRSEPDKESASSREGPHLAGLPGMLRRTSFGRGGGVMNPPATVRTRLMACLRGLQPPTVQACFEQAAIRAQQESPGYEQYLLEVVERECEDRRHRRIQRLMNESRVPAEKSLHTFELKRLLQKVIHQIRISWLWNGQTSLSK